MNKKLDVVVAQTHTPEYLLHKYWARKPHNVISYFLSELVPKGGTILDPFCGSGVVLHEAQKLGINSIGFDINPIATLITKVLINPPQVNEFSKIVSSIIDKIDKETFLFYSTENKKRIKYLIHNIVVQCRNCQKSVSSIDAKKNGRKSLCPYCQSEIKFNLEYMIDSTITSISIEGNKESIIDNKLLQDQKNLSNTVVYNENMSKYNYPFSINRRILAFDGLETKNLFTPRNYSIVCHIADKFNEIKQEDIRDAALLLLTACVAQCSRLIPARNNLSTGGPAWSVPGFWVPAQHLETNPIFHLRARFKKFIKGLHELNATNSKAIALVEKVDAINGMSELIKKNKKADLVFWDPPYGDNIPYIEFSALWNSFLKDFPNPSSDYSVSDRESKELAWTNYRNNMSNTLNHVKNLIKHDGYLLLTFNNNDIKAWEALISSLQSNNFICKYVTYQIPAVLSSKAQFSPSGSYQSDIYGVFYSDKNSKPTTSLSPVVNKLIKCATSRKGKITKNLANRVIMIEWIRNNIDSSYLSEKEDLLSSLFKNQDGYLIYTGNIPINSLDLSTSANSLAKEILSNGPCEWSDLYKTISSNYEEYGFLDSSELRSYLNGHILFKKNKCLSYID